MNQYPRNQSPLYRVRGFGQLEKVLCCPLQQIVDLARSNQYRVFQKRCAKKAREVQHPVGQLEKLHVRIAALLKQVELPDYVYSQKRRSYVTNAARHVGPFSLVKTDIRKFYPSTSRNMVYRMFLERFECAEDVSHLLADVCCYQQRHLPTGSPLSGYVAFFSAKPMFDAIKQQVQQQGCVMTLFVDDISISGEKASQSLLGKVRQIVSSFGYITDGSKSVSYAISRPKTVTGVIVTPDGIKLPNCRHEAIFETKKSLKHLPYGGSGRAKLVAELSGRLREARQIISIPAA